MKNENFQFIATIIIVFLIAVGVNYCFCQLEVSGDPNYLQYNGVKTLFLCETPNDSNHVKAAKVRNFDLTYFKRAKEYGVNHAFITLTDLYEKVRWSALKACGNDKEYWLKLEAIAREAHDQGVVLGICLHSYSVFGTSPQKSAWNKECTECKGSKGLLSKGAGFFDYQCVGDWIPANFTVKQKAAALVELCSVINLQKIIMELTVKATGKYDNVYYVGMWEVGSSRARAQKNWAGWNRWFIQQMRGYEKKYCPEVKHLYAIEATPKNPAELEQWKDWGISFQAEEDGNALKQDGFPLMMWSCDSWNRGVYPGWPKTQWNFEDADHWTGECDAPPCEPVQNIDYMWWAVTELKVAGVASMWVADRQEQDMLLMLSQMEFFGPPPKCPVERNCEQCHWKVEVK